MICQCDRSHPPDFPDWEFRTVRLRGVRKNSNHPLQSGKFERVCLINVTYIYLAGIFYTDKNLQEKQSGKVERGCDHLRSVLNDLFEPRHRNCTKFRKSIFYKKYFMELSKHR